MATEQDKKEQAAAGADVADTVVIAVSQGGDADTVTSTESGRQSLWRRWLKVFRKQASNGQTAPAAEDSDDAHKTGLWATMTAVVMRRPKKAATQEQEEASEENASEAESVEKPGLRQRLLALFKRKQAATEEDATSVEEKKQKRAESAEPSEEPAPSLGRGRMLVLLLSKKVVWLPLLILLVALMVSGVSMVFLDMRKQEQAKLEVLEQKNQKLLEENRKLQQVIQPPEVPQPSAATPPSKPVEVPVPAQANEASVSAKQKKPAGSTGECAVSDKASVAEVLKGCIEEFNATDGR